MIAATRSLSDHNGQSEGKERKEKEMNALILAVLICICVALYAIWRTQTEILRVLRKINLKALNAALFLRDEPATDPQPLPGGDSKPN